jgi:hypothetical protein
MSGYYTRYELQVYQGEEDKVLESLIEEAENDPFEESCEWDEHEEDCIEVSLVYPGVFLVLLGEGDHNGDIWRKVFYKGKLVDHWQLDVTPPELNFEALAT